MSKDSFTKHLKAILTKDDIGKVQIFLPENVTIKERHQVHLYSKKNKISGVSNTYNGKRIMKIVLEANYVKELKTN